MIIAVTYENGLVFQHFGHTEQFKLYHVDGGHVTHSQVVDTNGSGHGALAGLLQNLGVDTLICGGIGGGAKSARMPFPYPEHAARSFSTDRPVSAKRKLPVSWQKYLAFRW